MLEQVLGAFHNYDITADQDMGLQEVVAFFLSSHDQPNVMEDMEISSDVDFDPVPEKSKLVQIAKRMKMPRKVSPPRQGALNFCVCPAAVEAARNSLKDEQPSPPQARSDSRTGRQFSNCPLKKERFRPSSKSYQLVGSI